MRCPTAAGRLQLLQVYRLLQYVRHADTSHIAKMVKLGVDNLINLTEPRDGVGALHLAAVTNNQDLLRFLLAQGAHPDVQEKRGRTPAMMAAELGHDATVALLAEHHADMTLVDAEGKGVLFYCISPTKRHGRCLQVALQAGADVNNISLQGASIFLVMCQRTRECPGMCLSLLDKGADPNVANQATGVTAMMEATKAGSLQLVRAILRKGGNPNALDAQRFSVVHYAAMGGNLEILQVLSAYSADMGMVNCEGNTPLHYAAAEGNANCCRFLSQRGCNPKLKNTESLLPRQVAKDAGHRAAAKELRKAERTHGKTAGKTVTFPWALTLHDWSHEHEAAIREALGTTGAVAVETVPTETFMSALQRLAAPVDLAQLQTVARAHEKWRAVDVGEFFRGNRYVQKVFLLSSYGPRKAKGKKKGGKAGKKQGKPAPPLPICTAPPELLPRRADGGPPAYMIERYQEWVDPNRFSHDTPPRHPIEDDSAWYVDEPRTVYVDVGRCVRTGEMESLDLAFSRRVPVDVKDRFYRTPLMVACATGNYDVARYLIGLGADVSACDQFLWTPLHHAAHTGQVDLLRLLLEAGAAVDPPTLHGATPLMRAIESSRSCCVDFLIRAGAKVTAQNKQEQNCLDIAKAYADVGIIDLVKERMDSLPKPKDTKTGRDSKRLQRPRLSSAMAKDKGSAAQIPVTSSAAAATADRSVSLKASGSQSIIWHNAHITSGNANRVDISFVPRSPVRNRITSSQLMAREERWRKHFLFDVDFEDFLMPFSQNVQRKALELMASS